MKRTRPGKSDTADRVLALQCRSNAESADAWTRYAAHRGRITQLATVDVRPGGCAGVLGAGNLNDVDLRAWLQVHRELHLVDVDVAAMHAGIERQGLNGDPRLVVHGPLDALGWLERVDAWRTQPPSPAALTEATAVAIHRLQARLPPLDLVLSDCMLSQAACALQTAWRGRRSSDLVAAALAEQHARRLFDLAGPEGVAVLMTDLVSSDTYPVDEGWTPAVDPDALLRELLATRNLFPVSRPDRLLPAMRRHPRVADVTRAGPWPWKALTTRSYLVYALCARG